LDTGTLRLVTFSFILSILFPTFAYAFTAFGETPEDFDVSLDANTLLDAGIQLTDGVSHNVTFLGGDVEYTVKNVTMRINWRDPIGVAEPYFANKRQGWVQKTLGTWWNAIEMNIIIDTSLGTKPSTFLTNATVINYFDETYNWTKYEIFENNLVAFITTLNADDNNITKAIYETGTVTITVGTAIFTQNDFGAASFLQWYRTVIFTGGSEWGLPSFMSWVVRIFSFMTLISGILVAKELREFLPI
jgi:hypothetical protein